MDTALCLPLTELAAGAIVRVPDGRGSAVMVFAGRVWVTQESDLRDVVLDPGESFRFDRNGLSLVTALRNSKVMLLAAEGSDLGSRVTVTDAPTRPRGLA